MAIIDYTLLEQRHFDLWVTFDPWTYHDGWPFCVLDGANKDEVIVRTGDFRALIAWLHAFERDDPSVSVDYWSLVLAVRAARRHEREQVAASGVRVAPAESTAMPRTEGAVTPEAGAASPGYSVRVPPLRLVPMAKASDG